MRGAGGRIALGVTRDDEPVELAEQRKRRAVAGAAGRLGPYAGERESRPGFETKRAERVLDEARRLHLFEAELGVLADAFAESNDLLGATVDGGVDAILQLVLRHKRSLSRLE